MKMKFPVLICLLVFAFSAGAQDKAASADPESDLRRAVETAGGGEAKLIENFEAFLQKHPDYRRADIEREIFRLSVKLRDRDRAIAYAERVLAANERDFEAITQLIDSLRERRAEGDLKRALEWADKFVERVEAALAAGKPGRLSQAQWNDRKERSRASTMLLRGRVLADMGETDRAMSELRRSFKAAKTAETAVALAELSEKRGAGDEAVDYYAQALALSFDSSEDIDRKAVRRKLGALYSAKAGSEQGLGDRLLKTYDRFVREREEREAALERPNINEGAVETFDFKLTRVEGGVVTLGDHRGKIIVLNFWATWCGPCRIEMPLFEATIARYKNDPDVVFLAVNTDEDREVVKPFLKEQKYKLPVVYADYLDEHFAIRAIPTTIVLDRNGGVSFRQQGFNSREDFSQMLSEKIEEAKKR
ncbi:MAG: redoxin family protein [Acidobacteria bacterium]|nr:redoxin family protein [Acidobacteriota bacterium]